MGYFKETSKNDYGYYRDLSSFNRIKRSGLVRSDDAVESVECHASDEEDTAHGGRQKNEGGEFTVPVLVRRHVDIMSSVQVSKQSCNVSTVQGSIPVGCVPAAFLIREVSLQTLDRDPLDQRSPG